MNKKLALLAVAGAAVVGYVYRDEIIDKVKRAKEYDYYGSLLKFASDNTDDEEQEFIIQEYLNKHSSTQQD
jgi:hypothetical protein